MGTYSVLAAPSTVKAKFYGSWQRRNGYKVQLYSVGSDSATPWTSAQQASLSFTLSQSLLKLTSIESVMPPNHLALCCPLLLLPSVFPSIRVFSNQSALRTRWPKYQSFSISPSPSNEYSGLISFRIDQFNKIKKSLFGVIRQIIGNCYND